MSMTKKGRRLDKPHADLRKNIMTRPGISEDERWMTRAVQLAGRGEGFVEPNPMVGCVLVLEHETTGAVEVVGEGWHHAFGRPHAEVEAIRAAQTAGKPTEGSTAYVTLEPCCHYGKTPPCVKALIEAGVRRVVVAMRDPFAKVDGGGISQLREHGVDVSVGCLEAKTRELNAPYLTRIEKRRPWVIAKWAMTLDGKIATRTGSSRWVSSEASRQIVHRLRARSDAVLVGSRTAIADDPLLTVRLSGAETADEVRLLQPHRKPLRVVFDSAATLPPTSRLAQTARETGVLVGVSNVLLAGNDTACVNAEALARRGCEILPLTGAGHYDRLVELLQHLAERDVTNLLVEGGGTLLGMLFELKLIDEVHTFIAPKLVGGYEAASPVEGSGVSEMAGALLLQHPVIEQTGTDVYCHGRIAR